MASLDSLAMPTQSKAQRTIGSPAPRITRPRAVRGEMISLAGLTRPLQRGEPMGGVASIWKVERRRGVSAARRVGMRIRKTVVRMMMVLFIVGCALVRDCVFCL